ncbi:hypothetical protein [Capnocytophaga canis]|uniref:hypothetical protein n=1 Tax=Capnocytophaga canis TaxID=1848903 RepID=UPI001562B2AD|nr:hypothetical protein [Capnocytophaga canis]
MNTIEIEKIIDLIFWVLLVLVIICGITIFFIRTSLKKTKEVHYSSYVEKIFSEQEKAFLNTLRSEEERVNYIQLTISNHNIFFFEKHKLLLGKDLEEIKQLPIKEKYKVTMHLMEKLIMNGKKKE